MTSFRLLFLLLPLLLPVKVVRSLVLSSSRMYAGFNLSIVMCVALLSFIRSSLFLRFSLFVRFCASAYDVVRHTVVGAPCRTKTFGVFSMSLKINVALSPCLDFRLQSFHCSPEPIDDVICFLLYFIRVLGQELSR